MKNNFIVGIDIGSSACKVTFLNTDTFYFKSHPTKKREDPVETTLYSKRIHSFTNFCEYKTYYLKPGWAEQNTDEWLAAVGKLIKQGLVDYNIKANQIISVGLSGVTHSPVLLDKNNKVMANIIHITDSRSVSQSEELKEYNNLFLKTCYNQVSPMWTISMLKWISEKEPAVWKNIKKIIFLKDYIRFMLTGNILTDEVEAEGTLLYNPLIKKWEDEFISLIKLDKKLLPDIFKPLDNAGKVTKTGSNWSGLAVGTPVITGTTDTLCEIFAAGNLQAGNCTIKLATFGRICVLEDKPFAGEGLITYSYIVPGLWYPGTGT